MKLSRISTLAEHISSFYNSAFGVQPMSDTQAPLKKWFEHSLGQRLLQDQKVVLDDLLPEVYGYHLMELSVLEKTALSDACSITHHFSLTPYESEAAQARAAFEQLPIDEESIDAAVLHHVLEYSTKPHQLLRETARTVIPNGYIVIVGFNPFSLLQIKKILGRYLLHKSHWRYHFLLRSRIVDWLRVLDFEVVYKKNAGFDLPVHWATPNWIKKCLRFLSPINSNFYVLVARKTKTPMTMIKPWKKKSRLSHWVKQPVVSRGSAHSNSIKKESHNENR